MKKNKKLFFMIMSLFALLPLQVEAKVSFVDENKKYTIEEKEISCLENMTYAGEDTDGNSIFSDENMIFYRLNSSDTCERLSNQEILNIKNSSISYRLEQNTNGDYIIVKETVTNIVVELFIKTQDTTPVDGKKYYLALSNNQMNEVVNLDSDISQYYEKIYLTYSKSATIDPDTTYYKQSSSNALAVEAVANPSTDEILSYYVNSIGEYEIDRTVIKTLPAVFKNLVGNMQPEVMMINDNDGFIIIGGNTVSLYDLDGNLMFENADDYRKVGNLYIVTQIHFEDNDGDFNQTYTTYFYNSNKKLLHSQEALYLGLKITSDSNTIKGFRIDGSKIFGVTIKVVTEEEIEENPQTFDSIESSIFMGVISLIGLLSAVNYLNKRSKIKFD